MNFRTQANKGSMNKIVIGSAATTPGVNLDPETGLFELRGKSIPSDAEDFYTPILNWMDEYMSNPAKLTQVVIDLDFFNISSSKRLLFLMYKLNELADEGHQVELKWHYYDDDDDMYEVGQDYAFMVKVPFEFVVKQRASLAV